MNNSDSQNPTPPLPKPRGRFNKRHRYTMDELFVRACERLAAIAAAGQDGPSESDAAAPPLKKHWVLLRNTHYNTFRETIVMARDFDHAVIKAERTKAARHYPEAVARMDAEYAHYSLASLDDALTKVRNRQKRAFWALVQDLSDNTFEEVLLTAPSIRVASHAIIQSRKFDFGITKPASHGGFKIAVLFDRSDFAALTKRLE